jgi:hypothetical protein
MDGRHHRVSREIIFVPVEVPVVGSPQPLKWSKPPAYPRQDRAPWRPATRPPNKASASKRLLDAIAESDAAAKAILRPLPPSATVAR